MPAQDVTLREMIAPPEPETHSVLVKGIDLYNKMVVEDRKIIFVGHHKLVTSPMSVLAWM